MYKLIGTNSVKRLSDGAYIPLTNENVDYEEYKQWILEGNTPEPEFTEEELRIKEINIQISEAKSYLADTGWYVERLNDPSSGKAIPEEVLEKRAEARELINTLEAELGGN